MNKEIEKEFLATKTLNGFRNLVIKYNINNLEQLSKEVLLHHSKLGNNETANAHTDPRKIK